jgi:hypothetical protein
MRVKGMDVDLDDARWVKEWSAFLEAAKHGEFGKD